MTTQHILLITLTLYIGTACTSEKKESPQLQAINFGKLPAISQEGAYTAVIEIPAGTTAKREYSYAHNNFPIDIKNDRPRYIDFIGYPGNYGFIPGTLMNEEQGGDGDALDVLVLGKPLPTSSYLYIEPIAIIQLLDNGEQDDKLIAVPLDDSLKTINAHTFDELIMRYPAVQQIIEIWFANYKGAGEMQVIGWQNEVLAKEAIEKWLVRKNN